MALHLLLALFKNDRTALANGCGDDAGDIKVNHLPSSPPLFSPFIPSLSIRFEEKMHFKKSTVRLTSKHYVSSRQVHTFAQHV